MQFAEDQNEEGWDVKRWSIALYHKVWKLSLPFCSVLPNLHYCHDQPPHFQITDQRLFIPHLLCSHQGVFFYSSLYFTATRFFQPRFYSNCWPESLLNCCNALCLAPVFLFLPQIIFVSLSRFGQTLPPAMHMHVHIWLVPRAILAFCILFKSFVFIY